MFLVGALIVSTPLLEHLVFTALLKQLLGIDLGISVPDANAYSAGCLLMLSALTHNLIFVRLNQKHAEIVKSTKTSTYKELWVHVDCMVDSTVRLSNLYCTRYRDSDKTYAEKAEQAIAILLEHTRKNRPFYFSEALYKQVTDLSRLCIDHTKSFRSCIQMKEENTMSYDFSLAEKSIHSEYKSMNTQYEAICTVIRLYVEEI